MNTLKQFSVSLSWWKDWRGGGHTIQTDPSSQGWRAAPQAKDSDVVLIGRRGLKGCITARQMASGQLDVAIYDEATPEEVAKSPRAADAYKQVAFVPGWALPFIQELT